MITSYYDKVCVITGASSGIGAEFARSLARRGAKLVLFARRESMMKTWVESLYNPESHVMVVGDVTRADDRARLIESAIQTHGKIDILINNAGIGGSGNFATLSTEQVERVLQVNLVSAVLLTHAALPYLKNGLIINVSSPMGGVNLPGFALYNTSKAGLTAFSQTLHRELSSQGIQVLNMRPGFTYSEMVREEETRWIPRFLAPRQADAVVEETLRAALTGKSDIVNGQKIIRFGLFVNHVLPALMDWGIKRFMPKKLR